MTEAVLQGAACAALTPAADTQPQQLQDGIAIAMLLAELQQQGALLYLYPPGGDQGLEGVLPVQPVVAGRLLLQPPLAAWPLLQASAEGWRMVAIGGGCIVQAALPALQWQDGLCWCALPAQLLRWQRRAYLRLDAPLGRRFSAAFSLLNEYFQANIYDLSLGGVGLYAAPRDLPQLLPGRQLPRVRLELGPGRSLQATLEVRLCRSFHSRLLGEQLHVGCRFIGMSEQSASMLRSCLAELAALRGQQ